MNDLLQTRIFGLLNETSQEITNEEMQNAYYFLLTVLPTNKPIYPGSKPIAFIKPAGYLSGQLKSLKAVPV